MSQPSAMLQLAPAAMPFTAQTTGKGSARSLSTSGIVVFLQRLAGHHHVARRGDALVQVLPGREGAAGAGDAAARGTSCRASASAIVARQHLVHRDGEGVEPLPAG